MQSSPKIILGIDPGSLLMGYGLISVNGASIVLVEMGVLTLNTEKDSYERLRMIHEKVSLLVRSYKPAQFAIEAPFFGKNVQSMLKLGRAQGVAIAAAMGEGIPVTEYSPRKIKQSITGNGNAGKEQVWKMLQQIMVITPRVKTSFDASDALAVAVCHHFQGRKFSTPAGQLKDWQDFIQRNPGRIV